MKNCGSDNKGLRTGLCCGYFANPLWMLKEPCCWGLGDTLFVRKHNGKNSIRVFTRWGGDAVYPRSLGEFPRPGELSVVNGGLLLVGKYVTWAEIKEKWKKALNYKWKNIIWAENKRNMDESFKVMDEKCHLSKKQMENRKKLIVGERNWSLARN